MGKHTDKAISPYITSHNYFMFMKYFIAYVYIFLYLYIYIYIDILLATTTHNNTTKTHFSIRTNDEYYGRQQPTTFSPQRLLFWGVLPHGHWVVFRCQARASWWIFGDGILQETQEINIPFTLWLFKHSNGTWPIEIDDFPSLKPPFMAGIFHGYVSHNQMV